MSRTKRTSAIAVILLAASTAAALVLAWHFHLGVPATLVAIIGGVPGLYMAWTALRDSEGQGPATLGEIADQLAVVVGTQWDNEARQRRLNDPWPLPVSWKAASSAMVDDW
jgi:hypothetical protein